jgi:hypothetical protein
MSKYSFRSIAIVMANVAASPQASSPRTDPDRPVGKEERKIVGVVNSMVLELDAEILPRRKGLESVLDDESRVFPIQTQILRLRRLLNLLLYHYRQMSTTMQLL